MNHAAIIKELSGNHEVFKSLLNGTSKEEYLWKPDISKWCLLEIVCHLYDEEQLDFRYRVKHVLETSEQAMPSINPQGWVKEKKYIEQNYHETLKKFLEERKQSIQWLQSLSSPKWKNIHQHPKLGEMSAEMILSNWLAHDYLHFRQIISIKYHYLQHQSGESLDYAGKW